jgi:predicted transcriptional regulator
MNSTCPSRILETVEKREAFLRCLSEGIDDKQIIENELSVSRSTVNRAFNELEKMGMIRIDHSSYALTLHGQLAYQWYQSLTGAYTHLTEAMKLSAYLPADVEVDLRLLEDAEVILSPKQTPQKPFQQVKEAAGSANHVKGCLSVVVPSYIDLFHNQSSDQNVTVELILAESLIPALSTTYAQKFTSAVTSDNCTLWQTAERLPFGLITVDNEMVWLCVYRDGGSLRGIIANNTDAAINWAMEVFEQYRDTASEILLSKRITPAD